MIWLWSSVAMLLLFVANVVAQGQAASPEKSTTEWPDFDSHSFILGQNTTVPFHITNWAKPEAVIALRLMQADAQDPSKVWEVADLTRNALCNGKAAACAFVTESTFQVDFTKGGEFAEGRLGNFFFCFGTYPEGSDPSACATYSPVFAIAPNANAPKEPVRDNALSTPLVIQTTSQIVVQSGDPTRTLVASSTPTTSSQDPTDTAAAASKSSFAVTKSIAPTGTTTITARPKPTAEAVTSSSSDSSSKKLSTGAIVGIALGGLVFVALLAIFIVFCCCRRRRKKNDQDNQSHEQVMLTRSLRHSQGGSRDLNEKDTPHLLIHPNSTESNFQDNLIDPNSSESQPRGNSNSRQSYFRETFASTESTLGRDSATLVGPHYTDGGRDSRSVHRESGKNSKSVPYETIRDTSTPEYNAPRQNLNNAPQIAPLVPQRHSDLRALGSFDFSSLAPRTGPTVAPLRKKPAASNDAFLPLSRNLSTSTNTTTQAHTNMSPTSEYSDYPDFQSPNSARDSGLHDFGEEHPGSRNLEPRYGDARHSPQIFSSGTLQAPLLSEPGMSPEEAARVEEEERMIDAAIAVAEAKDRDARAGLGK